METQLKFELSDETFILPSAGSTLYRIRALKDIPLHRVNKGDLGGFVEFASNLSQDGQSWIADDAKVYGYARVHGDAIVFSDAQVYGNAIVYGHSKVYGHAIVSGSASVYGKAQVYNSARVYGSALVFGQSWVFGEARISGNAQVYNSAMVSGEAKVYGNAHVYCETWVFGGAQVLGNAQVYGGAQVSGSASVYGEAKVYGNAHVLGHDMIQEDYNISGTTVLPSEPVVPLENTTQTDSLSSLVNPRVYGSSVTLGTTAAESVELFSLKVAKVSAETHHRSDELVHIDLNLQLKEAAQELSRARIKFESHRLLEKAFALRDKPLDDHRLWLFLFERVELTL